MMGIFGRLFRRQCQTSAEQREEATGTTSETLNWEKLAGYVSLESAQVKEVAVIAAAVAAGAASNSSFKIKRVMKRNPEATLVALIAGALAADQYPESQFRMTAIKKRKV